MMRLKNNLRQNILILVVVFSFLVVCFANPVESAQTKTSTKPTPTPTKKKTTPTPNKTAKAAATPKPKTSPTPTKSPTSTAFQQIIATAAGARVRAKSSTSSAEVQRVKLGTLIKVLEKTSNDWYRIEIPAKPKNVTGWMSGQVADDWDAAKKEDIYRRLVDKNYKPEGLSFLDASELFEFLGKAQTELKTSKSLPEYGLKQLIVLKQTLKAIPFGKDKENPYKSFLKTYDKSVVYSEPAGEWFVRSDLFWELRKKYAASPTAEEIAWTATQNPLPGECEGYVNCYLFILRQTDAEYLNLYPAGKYSGEALKNIQNQLEPIVDDLAEKKIYNGPSDVSDRAEFNRLIAEIRTIISKLPIPEVERQKSIQQLNQIAEAFR
ncbi:MAG TPA: SH3 domain-containing protein [Pyrinomonadaceae bacterium]|nr:SH3 domain-containing protein [Pyrinomonadaceae bacterium]